MTKGWYGNKYGHSLASKGIKTNGAYGKRWESDRNERIDWKISKLDPTSIYYDPDFDPEYLDEEFEAMGRVSKQQKIENLKDEFVEVYEEWRSWSNQKNRIMKEMFDEENPPTEERKRELYSYIEQYYGTQKNKFTHRLFEIQSEVQKLNNERITYDEILEERGRQ